MNEKLNLTAEEARDLLWLKSNEYKIIENQMVDQSRWTTYYSIVVKRLSDGKFFMDIYGRRSTECQDEIPWKYDEPNFQEVIPVEVKKTEWKFVEDEKEFSDAD
jgi:hypothetical protein